VRDVFYAVLLCAVCATTTLLAFAEAPRPREAAVCSASAADDGPSVIVRRTPLF